MNIHCEQGHELGESQKFCGECGSPAVGAEGACDCGATIMKGMKFCAACGAQAGPFGAGNVAELGAALDEVESYVKARAGLDDGDLALPILDETETRESATNVDRILKAATVTEPDTGEEIGVDAVPVVGAFMKGQDQLTRLTAAYAEHANDIARASFDAQTALMKAVVLIGRTVETLAHNPIQPGRPLGPVGVGLGGDANFGKANGARGGGQFDNLRGPDLLLKSTVAAQRNGDLLSLSELSAVEHFGNEGRSLGEIREIDPPLAARIEQALRETQAH